MRYVFLIASALLASPVAAQNAPPVNSSMGCSTGQAIGNVSGAVGCLSVSANTVQYVTPTTGQTVTSDGSTTLLIDPAGTLAALTIAAPASPSDKQRWMVGSSQIITSLTMSGGTIVGTVTLAAVPGYFTLQWNAASSKWFRVG